MDFRLVLGCNGRVEENGFTFCNAVENTIIEITVATPKRAEILKLLESANLFDDDIYDWNMVLNVIGYLKDRFGLINPQQLVEIQMFCKMHRTCGIYLRLDFS